MSDPRLPMLSEIERRALWLSTWMIHNANHIRPNLDGMKIGGHQASSASLATIMTVLYGAVLRPQDRVAVKPHASPIFHALQYLAGRQSLERLENFRGWHGAQSYPSRTKDIDDVDFSTGSVGLGVAQTLFASLAQDYVRAHGGNDQPEGRMVALLGDAEMDEGNIYEALLEGWKHGLRNTWWVMDYNRQSLDAVAREGLFDRFAALFSAFGWDIVVLKHGRMQQAAFAEPGGEHLREWIDRCPNQLYAALTFQGGAAWRARLMQEIGADQDAARLIAARSDAELGALMTNLGGHDLPGLLEMFESIDHDRPTVFIAYTIKGFGLPLAGHKDNHAGLMTPEQVDTLRQAMGVRTGHEWERAEGMHVSEAALDAFLAAAPFGQGGTRRLAAPRIDIPATLPCPSPKILSTQQGFGLILSEIARETGGYADAIVTTSPDVTVSTNLGGWVNRKKLFASKEMRDLFRAERIPSTYAWEFAPHGQHVELGIAEMNLFLMLGALGLSHSLFGKRLLPIGTLYDPFIERGLDALTYACYQDARFLVVATPSGVSLAPEGGAHQSIGTPLIGMSRDRLACFEPCFVDELAVILRFALDFMQREGDATPDPHTWLRDGLGGAAYLRLSTRAIEQPKREMTAALANDIIAGAYWLRRPGPNAEAVIACTGAVAPEAIAALGLLAEDRRDVGLLAITSADRLLTGWRAAQSARESGLPAESHIERLLADAPRHCGLVTVQDGHPAALAWLGAVHGNRCRSLGVTEFGQTGTVADLYRHCGIDTQGIVAATAAIAPGRPIRHLLEKV